MTDGRALLDVRRRPSAEDDEWRASWTELFFDLVFVLVVTQLSAYLHEHLSLRGAAETLFLLLVAWWAWLYTTWATNWFDPERGPVRGVLVVAMLASMLLLGLGAVTLWRTRDTSTGPVLRYGRRALLGVAGVVVGALVAIAGYGYVTTHVGRAVVPPDRLGVAHEDVTFTAADGLELEGWYIPSRNGATVIAFPGRKGPQAKARMLARHGYGVLLFDRRGEGRSEGEPNAWGWGGDADVKAAIDYLQTRPDVDPHRIGGIGLSVGGEMMIEAAANNDDLAAVVSEGAGARSTTEDMDQDDPALAKWTLGLAMSAVKTAAVAVSSNQAPPANLKDLAANVDQPMLLIAAPNAPTGEALNRGYAKAAGDAATLWEIPESGHVGGMAARPQEYERRVIGFFDRTLAP